MEINETELTVNGTVYVPKGTQSQNITSPIKIVVLQRGWVFIGRYTQDGDKCYLHNAHNIRVWGTIKGLSELVNGKTSKTVLDKCDGVIQFHKLTELFTIDVNESKWKEVI